MLIVGGLGKSQALHRVGVIFMKVQGHHFGKGFGCPGVRMYQDILSRLKDKLLPLASRIKKGESVHFA